jgi:DNA-binding CsgD family transcriptional regulator
MSKEKASRPVRASRRPSSRRRAAQEGGPDLRHTLAERLKELQCLYGISRLVEQCGNSMDRLLRGIVELIPPSWQYPEVACARITFSGEQYVTRNFRETPWKQASNIKRGRTKAGVVEVCYLKEMPASDEGPFLKEETALIDAIADSIGRTAERIVAEQKLRHAYKALKVESATLQEANVALRVVLARIEDEKKDMKEAVLANVDKILMPILHTLEAEVPSGQRAYVQLLRQNLKEIVSPFVDELSRTYLSLTPAEIQISHMIRSGLTTKEIARIRHVSPATVRGQRERIRRKLGIANKGINLVTYLQAFKSGLGEE